MAIRLNPSLASEVEHSAGVREICLEKAQRGAAYAQSIAPVDPTSWNPGGFRDSIHAEPAAKGARIVADSVDSQGNPNAVYIEVGTSDTPAHHVLTRTGEALKGL